MKKVVTLVIVIALIIAAIIYLQEPAVDVERVVPAVQKQNGVPAPELAGISGYINTDNITISELVGKKVILIDVWTYSCINCQRTLPYLTSWYDKYKDSGLEIIGVHSPEFSFEKKYENVQRAVEKWNINYPVVLDNDHHTWKALMNRYWPHKYLVDIDGYIVWDHIGEGGYAEAEKKIQELLAERMERLGIQDKISTEISEVEAPKPEFRKIRTPEIYLGFAFTRGNFGNEEGLPPEEEITYQIPSKLSQNDVYLEGTWFVDKDHVRLVSETGKMVLKYNTKSVNIVASGDPGSDIVVSVDDQEIGKYKVVEDDLYNVVEGDKYDKHTLEIEIYGSNFKVYAFTFG